MEIPGFRIERQIGRGGMATVYLAIQESLERRVALKVMEPSLGADPSFCERFLKEGKIVAQMVHPNIVVVHDIGVAGSWYYIAMEYIGGGDLKERIARGMSVEQSLSVLRQSASALGHAHRRGIVHRDVKPANILFREDDTAVLTDFGIAKASGSVTQLTAVGWAIGTPDYMSPEQALGQAVDGRSDLYSLGIVLFQMLTGRKPYEAPDPFATALMHVNQALPQLPVSLARFQSVLDRMLAKDPKDRFPDAQELLRALDAALSDATVVLSRGETLTSGTAEVVEQEAEVPSAVAAHRFARLWPWAAAAAVVLGVAGAGGYLYQQGFWRHIEPTPVVDNGRATPPPEVEISPPVTRPPLDAAQREKVKRLLRAAEAHQLVGRLIEPTGSNALETYRSVLDIDPTNTEAQQGVAQIGDTLAQQARAELDRGDTPGALATVEKGLAVLPEHPGLRQLSDELKHRGG